VVIIFTAVILDNYTAILPRPCLFPQDLFCRLAIFLIPHSPSPISYCVTVSTATSPIIIPTVCSPAYHALDLISNLPTSLPRLCWMIYICSLFAARLSIDRGSSSPRWPRTRLHQPSQHLSFNIPPHARNQISSTTCPLLWSFLATPLISLDILQGTPLSLPDSQLPHRTSWGILPLLGEDSRRPRAVRLGSYIFEPP
jgi:hypothetical protein